MKLYLAVAVVVLALIAGTEANDDETFEQKLAKVGQQIKDFGQQVASRTSAAFEDLNSRPFAVETRRWFSELFESSKQSISDLQQSRR